MKVIKTALIALALIASVGQWAAAGGLLQRVPGISPAAAKVLSSPGVSRVRVQVSPERTRVQVRTAAAAQTQPIDNSPAPMQTQPQTQSKDQNAPAVAPTVTPATTRVRVRVRSNRVMIPKLVGGKRTFYPVFPSAPATEKPATQTEQPPIAEQVQESVEELSDDEFEEMLMDALTR